MATYVAPVIKLRTLNSADGSATYTSPSATHTLVAGINYPLEVPYRSDEDPESIYIEVSLRPHNGVATLRERYVEDVVRRTLQSVVLGEDTPRSMLQVTIQVLEVQNDDAIPGGIKSGYQGEDCLDMVVGAVNASILGCLDGAVRMRAFLGAVLVGIGEGSSYIVSPTVKQRKQCASVHAFGFDSKGRCVLMESNGSFEVEEWKEAGNVARKAVCGSLPGGDADIEIKSSSSGDCLLHVIRSSVETQVARDERWKT